MYDLLGSSNRVRFSFPILSTIETCLDNFIAWELLVQSGSIIFEGKNEFNYKDHRRLDTPRVEMKREIARQAANSSSDFPSKKK